MWVQVLNPQNLKPVPDNICFGFKLDLSGDWAIITVPADKSLLAHTKAAPSPTINGIIEPLIGLETTNKDGFGH